MKCCTVMPGPEKDAPLNEELGDGGVVHTPVCEAPPGKVPTHNYSEAQLKLQWKTTTPATNGCIAQVRTLGKHSEKRRTPY